MEETYCTSSNQRVITNEVAKKRNALFAQYVEPYKNMIYKLCIDYSFHSRDVEENYTEVLANMYRYIETYNPEMSIHTWLHIVTKRYVLKLDEKRKRHEDMKNNDNDIEDFPTTCLSEFEKDSCNGITMENYREYFGDEILEALDSLKPQYRRALLYQFLGYKLKEIAEMEHRNGALESRNIDTVKSRLFLARKELQKRLTRDGKRRALN